MGEKTAFDAFTLSELVQLLRRTRAIRLRCATSADVAISTKEFCDSMGMYPDVLHEYIKKVPTTD